MKEEKNKTLVTLTEFGDFECPYCKEAYPIVEEHAKEIKGIKIEFRNFPLAEVHPHATHAAYAAEAAANQGRFWEMYHLLFKNQDDLEDNDLLSYATKLKLNVEKFKNDFKSDKVAEKVRTDFMEGVKKGVNGTPTFFINDKRFNGSYDKETLQRAIGLAIK
jgi:protein-disulfide isomerase